ncbi:MAG: hypothetical protein GY862_23160 [Gammaproteobacteria bacterium]|nr:hypothetical protein [Gammaproteobacteria bacterium]
MGVNNVTYISLADKTTPEPGDRWNGKTWEHAQISQPLNEISTRDFFYSFPEKIQKFIADPYHFVGLENRLTEDQARIISTMQFSGKLSPTINLNSDKVFNGVDWFVSEKLMSQEEADKILEF